MALKNIQRRKRTFTTMSSSPIIIQHHLNPSLFCMLQSKSTTRDTNYYAYNNHYTFNFNVQCDYIGNPKPSKRLKLSHSSTNQCNTKCIFHSKPLRHTTHSPTAAHQTHMPSKPRHKSPKILHYCVINERWNMLMSLDPNPPKKAIHSPLLNILSDLNRDTNRSQMDMEHKTDYADDIHCYPEKTPSIAAYESADAVVPEISIQDAVQNIPNTYGDAFLYSSARSMGESVWSQSTHSSTTTTHRQTPWNNTTHKEDMHRYPTYTQYPSKQATEGTMHSVWRLFVYLLIVCAIGWKYGMRDGSFDEKQIVSDIHDANGWNWSEWMVFKWVLVVMMMAGILGHILYLMYRECALLDGDWKKENVSLRSCNINHCVF